MNYERVIEGFNDGTIDDKKWQVVMDNDGGYWSYVGADRDDRSEEWVEAEESKMEKKYGSPNGYCDIVSVLTAAGVPCEWC